MGSRSSQDASGTLPTTWRMEPWENFVAAEYLSEVHYCLLQALLLMLPSLQMFY